MIDHIPIVLYSTTMKYLLLPKSGYGSSTRTHKFFYTFGNIFLICVYLQNHDSRPFRSVMKPHYISNVYSLVYFITNISQQKTTKSNGNIRSRLKANCICKLFIFSMSPVSKTQLIRSTTGSVKNKKD